MVFEINIILFLTDFICSLDNKSAGRQSIASNLMKNDDEVDDGDSMAAYGEGDTGKVLNANKHFVKHVSAGSLLFL